MEDTSGEWVSLREFARRCGVNPNAIQKAISNGRIERRDDKKIHWPTQSQAFADFRDLSKVRDGVSTEKPPMSEDISALLFGQVFDDAAPAASTPTGYQDAKARREIAIAGLKELELEIARGEVVRSSHVRSAMAQFSIDVRDAVMSIPDRVASELAAEFSKVGRVDHETARDMVHRVWRRESRLVLEKIARAAT